MLAVCSETLGNVGITSLYNLQHVFVPVVILLGISYFIPSFHVMVNMNTYCDTIVDHFRVWCWFGDWGLLSDPGELSSWYIHP